MSAVERLRRLRSETEALLGEVLKEASSVGATLILFGSRARGDHSLMSDYDLLAIYRDMPVKGGGIIVNVFNLKLEELEEEAYRSPLVLSALLTGRVVLDGLGIEGALAELRERLKTAGARVESDRIVMPKRR